MQRKYAEALALLALTLGAPVWSADAGNPVNPASAPTGSTPQSTATPEKPAATAAAAPSDADTSEGKDTAGASPGAASQERCSDPVCLYYSRFEGQRNHVVLHDADIFDNTRQLHVKADLAEGNGIDAQDNHWVLTGHVQVTNPQGQLQADRATVQVSRSQISSMSAQGSPALFQGTVAAAGSGGTAAPVHGHAQQIDYDLGQSLLDLNGNSYLSDGCNDITSPHIRYNIAGQSVQADGTSDDNGRVHGTIRSRAPGQCNAAAAAKP